MMNRSLWSASWHGVPGGLLAWPVCFCIATSKKSRVLEHLVERLEDTMALRYNKRLCASFVRTLVYVPSFGVLAHTPQSSRSKSFALRRTSLPTEPQSATQRAVGESRALLSSADPQSLRPRWRRKERGWHAVGIPTRACASRGAPEYGVLKHFSMHSHPRSRKCFMCADVCDVSQSDAQIGCVRVRVVCVCACCR